MPDQKRLPAFAIEPQNVVNDCMNLKGTNLMSSNTKTKVSSQILWKYVEAVYNF
jgi:hypothetical protein